ncbi:MAG: winged helix-turn-helix domain-containing protein [Cyanobacteria bacterium P01_A01_bin.114]
MSELKIRYRESRDPIETRRWQLIWLVSEHQSLTASAAAVGLNYDYARDIVRAYNTEGAAGLCNRLKANRPERSSTALLSQAQCKTLRARLQTPPGDGGVWSGPKVAKEIARMTGREQVWPQRGWEYLKALGYSCQQPRPRHTQGDAIEQAAFKKSCLNVKPS